jgi:ssDNA-binding Zn-finger/Zn-ribbon topoisomerase 1
MTSPKMSFAIRAGVITHVSEVTSGKYIDCVCPACAKPVVAKKGGVMQHHFAHDRATTCSLESVLHWLGKCLIYEGVKKSIARGDAVPLQWQCESCGDEHIGNLLRKAKAVNLEVPLGPARPDVLLLDGRGEPIVAIEVVVTHPPEAEARAFYRAHQIDVLVVKIDADADIETLRAWKGLRASSGTPCTRRKCPHCGHPLMPSPLRVVLADCYKCGGPMKIAFKSTAMGTSGPPNFTEYDIRLAKASGCQLQVRYSRVTRSRYLANTCGNCEAFSGQFYLHEYLHLPDIAEQRSSETYCPNCDNYFD